MASPHPRRTYYLPQKRLRQFARGRIKEMRENRWDAVVFDYGRVLSCSPTAAEIAEFAAIVGVREPPFFQLYSDTRDEYDRGRHDCHEHWQRFARAADVQLNRVDVER